MLLKHRTGQGQWKSVDDNSLNKDQLTTKQNVHSDPQIDASDLERVCVNENCCGIEHVLRASCDCCPTVCEMMQRN